MRLLPCGEAAILVELDDAASRRSLDKTLTRSPITGVAEHVPAARTVLLKLTSPSVRAQVAQAVRQLTLDAPGQTAAREDVLTIEVRYDGEDLDEVADHLGLTRQQVIERHTGQSWYVDFAGFMPGFGYLTGESGGLTVPRRSSPRTRIPAGSLALAGDFTGLYPQASPGGWQLIGSTDVTLWDTDRQPPALLTPGRRVRFVEVS